ncbi:MAG: deoxynucleoside kinase [Clostridiales bacterium]|nr:deoxynucleoside kinase [Clostridiales bacterium]
MNKGEIPFRHIAIEGAPKCQKSKLAQILAQIIGGKVVLDKTENPYLKDFYDEKEGASFLAQLVFLVNRYNQQLRLSQRDLFEERVICDYLFEKDKIYAYQTLGDDELVVYERIYTILAERIPRPDLTIYLQISLSTLLKRVAKEGSPWEKNISEKYLGDLVEAFDYFFFNFQATPLLVVKADELDLTREEDIMDVVHQISQLKKGSLYYVPQSFEHRNSRKK